MNLKIEYVKTSELREYENNAKLHPADQIEQIKKSIQQFGMNDPIAVWKDNVIIEGHGRLIACRELGIEELPVIRLDNLTDEQRRAYTLAHNKLTMNSDFDLGILADELDSIVDIDMEDFGFLDENRLMQDIELDEENNPDPETVEDVAPEVQSETTTQTGDIFILGNHRLMCGDSTNSDDIKTLMDGAVADMVFTDPPYGMKKENEGVLNDNLNYDDLLEFNKEWIPLTFNVLKDTGCWYCWGIDEPLMDIYSGILRPMKKANKIVVRNYITWAKHTAFGINSDLQLSYPKETEKCWFIMKGMDWNNNNAEFFNTKYERLLEYMQNEAEKAGIKPRDIAEVCGVQMYSHWFSKSQFHIIPEKHYKTLASHYEGCFERPYEELRTLLGDTNNPTDCLKPYFDNTTNNPVGDIGLTDVWRFPPTSNKEREGLNHATPKPIALCARGIHTSSRQGENVLDVFGGSGSTLIACEQLGRKCYMMELDPHYCDVIVKRWENLTGKKAVKL